MEFTKECQVCKRKQPLSEFHTNTHRKDGKDGRCKSCKREQAAQKRLDDYFEEYVRGKRSECKKKGIEFNLTAEHIEDIWDGKCAITGHTIEYGKVGMGSHHADQAHLDRFNPDGGYVIGNVAWVSGRINRIKYNATIEEITAILNYMIRGQGQ